MVPPVLTPPYKSYFNQYRLKNEERQIFCKIEVHEIKKRNRERELEAWSLLAMLFYCIVSVVFSVCELKRNCSQSLHASPPPPLTPSSLRLRVSLFCKYFCVFQSLIELECPASRIISTTLKIFKRHLCIDAEFFANTHSYSFIGAIQKVCHSPRGYGGLRPKYDKF